MNNENLNKLLTKKAYDILENVQGETSNDCKLILHARLYLEEVLRYHTFDWYFVQLPGLYVNDKGEIVVADENSLDCYLPNLSYQGDKWLVIYSYDFENSVYKVFMGKTPLEAVVKAYNWCAVKGFIKNSAHE